MTVTQDGTTAPLGDDPELDVVEESVATDVEPEGTGAEDAPDAEATDDGDAIEDEYEDEDEPFVVSPYDQPGRWYVVHTYAGYENKVKSNLHSRTVSMSMEDRIY